MKTLVALGFLSLIFFDYVGVLAVIGGLFDGMCGEGMGYPCLVVFILAVAFSGGKE